MDELQKHFANNLIKDINNLIAALRTNFNNSIPLNTEVHIFMSSKTEFDIKCQCYKTSRMPDIEEYYSGNKKLFGFGCTIFYMGDREYFCPVLKMKDKY